MKMNFFFHSANYAFFFLLIPLFIWAFWSLEQHRRKALAAFADESMLTKILKSRSPALQRAREALLLLAFIALVLALMEPKGNPRYAGSEQSGKTGTYEDELLEMQEGKEQELIKQPAHELIVLIDASASMSVKDTYSRQSRLDLGKEIADELISLLSGQSVALYAFTSDLTKLVPATWDYLYTRLLLKNVQINEGDLAGTNLMETLDSLQKEEFEPLRKQAHTLLILTDGGDTQLEGLEGEAREEMLQAFLGRFADAEKQNLRVFTVGLGTAQGETIPDLFFEGKPVRSSLDEGLLKGLSEKGRGRYYFAEKQSSYAIAEDIIARMEQEEAPIKEELKDLEIAKVERKFEEGNEIYLEYDEYFQIPLAFAILFLTFSLLLPERRDNAQNE